MLGYGISFFAGHYRLFSLSAEVYSIDYVPFAPRVLDGLLVACISIGISFISTLYTSWSAASVLPAEALPYEWAAAALTHASQLLTLRGDGAPRRKGADARAGNPQRRRTPDSSRRNRRCGVDRRSGPAYAGRRRRRDRLSPQGGRFPASWIPIPTRYLQLRASSISRSASPEQVTKKLPLPAEAFAPAFAAYARPLRRAASAARAWRAGGNGGAGNDHRGGQVGIRPELRKRDQIARGHSDCIAGLAGNCGSNVTGRARYPTGVSQRS